MGGAERVVLALHEAFPKAPIYTSVYEPEKVPLFKSLDVRTTSLQRLPKPLRRLHKLFPTMRVNAFQKLDLSAYDIIISSSSAEAKQVVKTRNDQVHISYCHTPIRYYWSHYEDYKRDPGFDKFNWLVRLAMPMIVPKMRRSDYEAAQKVDVFVANSTEVQDRIKQYYHRTSTVLHPPVDADRFAAAAQPQTARKGYVIVGRQVPYKRVDIAVEACTKLQVPLTVYGHGSEHERLKKLAGQTIRFVTDASDEEIAKAVGSARAFLFPTEEDFGIVQVEALAAGTPVIAYGKGGALDIIQDGQNGLLFPDQTAGSLMDAIERFERTSLKPADVQRTAKRYAKTLFISKIRKIASDSISK